MTTLEEIKNLQGQGLTESQIKSTLKAKGISDREIQDSLSQSQIKAAVEQPQPFQQGQGQQGQGQQAQPFQQGQPFQQNQPFQQQSQQTEMQPSLLPPEQTQQQPFQQGQGQQAQPFQQGQGQQAPQITPPIQPSTVEEYSPAPVDEGYEEYQPYQSYSSVSSEMITEITEQLISEKLSQVRKNLEKALDSKNTIGTKIDYIEERVKRIEKIMDTLQSSVLRKVGDYVTDVQDIKTELIETQKSLSKLFPEIHKKSHKINHSKTTHTKHKPVHKKTTHKKK